MSLVVDRMPSLGITRVSRWIFNCYVLPGDDGPVVVDAGLPSTPTDVTPVLAELPGRLQAVVATHGHSDHVAGAAALAATLSAPIFLPAVTVTYLRGQQPRTPSLAKVARVWPTLLDQPFDGAGASGLIRGTRVAGFGGSAGMVWSGPLPAGGLHDGQAVPGASEWEVVHAAGHTDDSIAFWHAGTRTLVAGDAVLSARGRAWLTPEVVDTGAARRTAKRLQRLPVEHLLPGHGRPVHAASVWSEQRI